MRKLLLPFFAILMFQVSILTAQITITQPNFPRGSQFTDSFMLANSTGIVFPSLGANQSWDYSNLVSASMMTESYYDASSDPNFPSALNVRSLDLVFQALPITSNSYEAIDANGFYELGRSINDTTHSITSVSGGTNDSLRFVGGNYVFPGRINNLKFPVTFGSAWNENHEQNIDFELTVAGFALNQAPGQNKAYYNQVREVVGYGQLIIPIGSAPSMPINALLLKVVRTRMDSFFLGGNPAPAPLMAAFGLTQGTIESDSFYVFYTENFGAPVLNINIMGTSPGSIAYRPQAGTAAVSTDEKLSVHEALYPNPVKAGNTLTIQGEASSTVHTAKMYDINGRLVYEQHLTATANQLLIPTPETLLPGMYILSLEESNGYILSRNRISIY